jgi:hypothetical protein
MAACVVLGACETHGPYVEPERAQRVQQSVTTADQLEKALGMPTVTVPLDNGKTLWVYDGVHKSPNAASYIPYVGLLAGGNNKKCTRITVMVDQTGQLSNWNYSTESGSEHWTNVNDRCVPAAKTSPTPTSAEPTSTSVSTAPAVQQP